MGVRILKGFMKVKMKVSIGVFEGVGSGGRGSFIWIRRSFTFGFG